MARLCERPGCSIPASVLYGFEAAGAVVWLDAWSADEPRRNLVGVLCRRHADALTPPRGWWLDDRRIAVPRLFDVPASAEPDDVVALGVAEPVDAPAPAPIDGEPPSESASSRAVRPSRRKPGHDTEELPFPFSSDEVTASEGATVPDEVTASDGPTESREVRVSDEVSASVPGHVSLDRPEPDETRAMAWSPRFDRRDDLGGVLSAESRLLSRAFGVRRSPS